MTIDWRTRGFVQPEPVTAEEFLAARHRLFDGPFTWPLMVARESALDHNVRVLADHVQKNGLLHAPHGKTTMSPQLFAKQLAAGAWGLTAATASQVMVYRNLGVERVLLANEIYDTRAIEWLARQDFAELLVYADSPRGVELLAGKGFRVLVELGHPGGRTGCRTADEAKALKALVDATDGVEFAGVSGYEGTQPDRDGVRAYLKGLRRLAEELDAPIVSAGGSSYFDLVTDELAGMDARVIVRPGAYIGHDEGFYARMSPFADRLRPALEVYAQVLSTPEPGLAIVGLGKRDVPHDLDLPIAPDGLTVTGLQDQHTYLSDPGGLVRPGDVLRFGISHPCTAFDKWRVIPVVDDDHIVVDLLTTYF
ncbi:alanine racemase [Herbidospora cretacea]|uniref:alanine racemase n=1 Tax=Herbidospora cretacea TaxID=28444 RepID=UPI0004C2FA04|nr:alanine racemase [Herbidospora cretacea]